MKLRSLSFELPNGGVLELTPADAEALYHELRKIYGKPDTVHIPVPYPSNPWRKRLDDVWPPYRPPYRPNPIWVADQPGYVSGGSITYESNSNTKAIL